MPPPDSNAANYDDEDLRFVAGLRHLLAESAAINAAGGASLPTSLLESIVRAAARAIPCPEGALFLIDQTRRVLTFEVVIGSTARNVRDLTVPLGHGIAGLVAASGQALAISNAQQDPRHARDVAEKSGYLPTTVLAVPVLGPDGTPVGVLELLDRQGQPTFGLDDMDVLGMFADQVAIVLEIRRHHDIVGAHVGALIATLAGLPADARNTVISQTQAFADRLASDDVARQAGKLASLVASIASRGQAERTMCTEILSAVDRYRISAAPYEPGMLG